jgi:hypothetical protein
MGSKVAVVVSTFDRHAAAWPPFCHGFKKYWPDCPWPLKWMVNRRDPPCGEALKTGGDMTWSTMIRKALEMLEEPVFLTIVEDCWLTAPTNTQALVEFSEIILRDEADVIQLSYGGLKARKADFPGDPRLFIYREDVVFRASLMSGLWRVSTFLQILNPAWDNWQFEVNAKPPPGTDHRWLRINQPGFLTYVSHHHPDYGMSAVASGGWTSAAEKYAKIEGLQIDFSRQPREGP